VGEPSEEFAGFQFEPVYRPLMAVSVPNYRDPENWNPTGISASTIAALHKAFRGRFPRVLNCANNEERPKLWAYPDANVVVKKSYGSSRGWLIAQLSLIGYKCDGPPDEAIAYQAFAVPPQQQIRFLDSGMSLVDAGDYVNDGRSELIFVKGGYNRDGYKLFYDDFRRGATFQFGYH